MIKHTVMFKFLDTACGRSKKENLSIASEMLNGLMGKVPTLLSSQVFINSDSADKSNYDLLLITEFNGFDELKEYANHPLHLKVVDFIKEVRESRACVDYEL